ncbi:F-box/LRR-repeat protein At4g14103-like [Herrania umbratica]|uniref:F-box/LRR-repeat protein At4g14103-like n=1 Tax=Herrania umbratica TaxID=108875 RepID=A0A6J1APS7_9ROSI|nr:F-box/LRR-repeat protein At4g14103-like [Herrania umbratica]
MAKQVKVSEVADSISSLPDEVLSHIISFLPLKQAVCTSILSKRWSKISTLMSNLNLEDCFTRRKSDCHNFMNFVDRILFYHTGVVEKFRIRCGGFVDSYRLAGWIRYALQNDVRELDLSVACKVFNMLPVGVFTCKTLVALRLHGHKRCMFDLKVPVKICLPSLKILHLSGVGLLDDDSINRLFSSCSLLEELVADRCILKTRCRFKISIPTLKRLTIAFHERAFKDYEIVIDAPSLVYFKCRQIPKGFFHKNLNSLVEADIEFGTVLESDNTFPSYNTAATDLFKGISNVKSLRICGLFGKVFPQGRIVIPELPKLTYLSIDGRFFVGWESMLPVLLASFPCLESLVLKVNTEIVKELLSSQRFPSCLWSQLKTLKILSFQGRKEMQMVGFFLKNAEVLENFSVEPRERKRPNPAKWRSKITKKLLKLPKASKNCKVLVV